MSTSKAGTLSAIGAFFLWGILPAFWKHLDFLAADAVVAQRTLWSLALLLPLMLWRGRLAEVRHSLSSPSRAAWQLLSGLLLAANWIVYVWATLHDRIIESALGYYLSPFLNMLLGRLLFSERHSPRQLIAVGIAAIGVALQFPAIRGIPWVALTLAASFTLYGLARKRATSSSLPGITSETLLLAPLALGWLIFTQPSAGAAFGSSVPHALLVAATGFATAIPLLLFGHAARSIPLSSLGILQFIAPTLQFLIGWLIYQEPMSGFRTLSFALIWLAVVLYGLDSLRMREKIPLPGDSRLP